MLKSFQLYLFSMTLVPFGNTKRIGVSEEEFKSAMLESSTPNDMNENNVVDIIEGVSILTESSW